MDFRLRAYVGSLSALRDWKRQIPSALVVALTDDLGLVPETSAFVQDLRRHLKAEAQSDNEVVQLWGAQASKDRTLAYIFADSMEDFFIDGVQYVTVWANQQVIEESTSINKALQLLGVERKEGMTEFHTVDLGRYETTESWAAAASLDSVVSRTGRSVTALIKALIKTLKG